MDAPCINKMTNYITFNATVTPNKSFILPLDWLGSPDSAIRLNYAYAIQTQSGNNFRLLRLKLNSDFFVFLPTNLENPENGDLIGYPLINYELPKLILNRQNSLLVELSFGAKLSIVAERIKSFNVSMIEDF